MDKEYVNKFPGIILQNNKVMNLIETDAYKFPQNSIKQVVNKSQTIHYYHHLYFSYFITECLESSFICFCFVIY